jgi:hypothetical protein
MNTYAYRAALWCEPCAEAVMRELRRDGVADDGTTDAFPQGAYADGGGEADGPQHCDGCGLFLRNPLTRDGEDYVRREVAHSPARGTSSRAVLDEWAGFYSYLWRAGA